MTGQTSTSPKAAAPAETGARIWHVRVGERQYGPYSQEQMTRFIGEGRVVAESLVAAPGHPWREAASVDAFAGAFRAGRAAPGGLTEPDATSETAQNNVLLFLEDRWRPDNSVPEAIEQLGPCQRINEHLWAIRSRFSAAAIRNHLATYLTHKDRLFVVDLTNDRSSWYNFDHEVDNRVHSTWIAQQR